VSARTSRIVVWLFVMNLGIAFGAGLYEHRIVVPEWIRATPEGLSWSAETARHHDTGLRFWAFVTTGPLTALTLLNLYMAWKSSGKIRRWWLGASACALGDRLVTFGYFIPAMLALMEMPDSAESVAIAARWAALNHVRHALVLAAWVAALKAFAVWRTSNAPRAVQRRRPGALSAPPAAPPRPARLRPDR
jgi:hypothetical protein